MPPKCPTVDCYKGKDHAGPCVKSRAPAKICECGDDAVFGALDVCVQCGGSSPHIINWKTGKEKEDSPKVQFAGGAGTSSPVTSYRYIPTKALKSLIDRFLLGVQRHGDQAWNAVSPNFGALNNDRDWVIARLEHVIEHAKSALDKIHGVKEPDGEDDAGALLFGGAVLSCSIHDPYKKELHKREGINGR